LGTVPHIAVFDTAFHSSLPSRAREYAVPRTVAAKYALRRYGFHGINHAHVAQASAAFLKTTPQNLRIISCHLGNGASVTAIEYGNSVETSMGMTPLEGLMMGSRAGDVDAGILLHLLHSGDFDTVKLDQMLNKESGLVGFTGTFDFAAIESRAAAGDEGCRQAITLYAHRVRKYVGAYAAVMGGVDAIVFTAGIGEHSAIIRHRVGQRFDYLGATIDEDRNREVKLTPEESVIDISAATSRTKVLVVRADEELQMVREAVNLIAPSQARVAQTVSSQPTSAPQLLRIPVAVSARHAHLTVATMEALFGKGYELKKRADLSQHGQFAAQETVSLIGPKGRIDKVRLMGPPRKQDQIEITRTDEFALGIDAPVRLSGDLANTPGITLEGPLGRVTIASGVICALRHIHMSPVDGQRFGVNDHDTVSVHIDSDGRDLTFSDVMVRIAPDYSLEMHLDTDEANAAGVVPKQEGEMVEVLEATSLRATVKRE
jgi:acetate kinase